MKNALSFLLLMLVSTVPAPAEDNFSFPQDQKVRTVGNAVFEKLENGNILFSAKPGKGWPQIIFQDVPVDPEADRLFIRIKQCSPEKKDIPVLAESVTAGAMPPRYIHSLLKPGKFVDLALKLNPSAQRKKMTFRIACSSPKTAGAYEISGFRSGKIRTLADGWGFENPADSGTSVGPAEITGEYAFRGKKSLKMKLTGANDCVTLIPDITDWRPYKELRFTLYNPQPVPNLKTRVLQINGKYLPRKCSIRSGNLTVKPENHSTFVLDLETLPASIDRAKITRIQFFKGSPNTVFYLDEMKLYTAEEAEISSQKKLQEEIGTLIRNLRENSVHAGAYLKKRLDETADLLEGSLQDLKPAEIHMTKARELLALAAVLKGRSETLVLHGAPPTEKIFRDQMFNAASAVPFRISAAGNERESFQIVAFPNGKQPGVTVSASSLSGPDGTEISAKNVRINPVGYIELENSTAYSSSRNGFWPEVLQHNRPLDLADCLQPYWITVYVPSGQKAGIYRGTVDFSANGKILARFPYEVRVFGFSLPVRGKCLTFFDWRYSPEDPAVRRRCYDLMLDCRLNPTGMYVNGNAQDGKRKPYQFHPHPDDLEHCLKRGLNLMCIWYLYDPDAPFQFSREYYAKVKTFLEYFLPVLKKHKASDIAVVNGFDEIMHQDPAEVKKRLGEAVKICSWLKHDFPDVKLCNVGKKMAISTDLMDIWFLGALPKEKTRDLTGKGGKVCFYSVYGNPGLMIDLPGMAPRILAWQAVKYDAAGIAYYSTYRPWAFNCPNGKIPTSINWSRRDINAATFAGRRSSKYRPTRQGDGNLFWPDADGGVLPSIRIHNVRDGIEDYEYFALLRQSAPNHPLLSIPDSIVMLGSDRYTKDYGKVSSYREKVAQAIEKLNRSANR